MLKIKISKHCENLIKVSNEIKQYVKNTIVRSHYCFEQIFPI